jgi:hypothetical protein
MSLSNPTPQADIVQRVFDENTDTLRINILSSLVPKVYDYISLGYTGNNITTVVYKTGGSGGTTVATLTLAYSGNNITSITRT